MKRGDRPKRPYTSFEHFCAEHRRWQGTIRGLDYPCFRCHGSDRIIDPDERPDPIEGHKLSRRIKCPSCVHGAITQADYRRVYHQEITKWREATALFDRQMKVYSKAIMKLRKHLTKAERRTLGFDR